MSIDYEDKSPSADALSEMRETAQELYDALYLLIDKSDTQDELCVYCRGHFMHVEGCVIVSAAPALARAKAAGL